MHPDYQARLPFWWWVTYSHNRYYDVLYKIIMFNCFCCVTLNLFNKWITRFDLLWTLVLTVKTTSERRRSCLDRGVFPSWFSSGETENWLWWKGREIPESQVEFSNKQLPGVSTLRIVSSCKFIHNPSGAIFYLNQFSCLFSNFGSWNYHDGASSVGCCLQNKLHF